MKKSIALGYNKDIDHAPKVLAKGSGVLANRIIQLAEQEEIPLLENPELAESMMQLELNQNIPVEMYAVMAEILNFVYQQKVE
ncbi:MAG: EscU/YscU/HrcU family type III secretion system export apparatus switch protein [Spirochaetaceae bacterium]|jgi:flagellar biosynthesis protein|nr:EscU/YscU/HrcU family type III secretion system export apparatus switch protein [Spirochaetaceae bacterium]